MIAFFCPISNTPECEECHKMHNEFMELSATEMGKSLWFITKDYLISVHGDSI